MNQDENMQSTEQQIPSPSLLAPPPLVRDIVREETRDEQAQEPAADAQKEIQPEVVTHISDLQRMSIAELNQYAKNIGLRHLGSLTKSQVVLRS